ncbi:MAG: hypothetical protein IJQ31_03835 [Thermoguttaceae bacterium]|nr:hypothetical protein [Thermoguttaceae bacterium]
MYLGLLVFLSGGILWAKPASSGSEPASEPAPMDISEELIPGFEGDILMETAPKTSPSSDQNVTPDKNVQVKTGAKTGEESAPPQTGSKEAEGFFKPLREGEIEISLVHKAAAPILPDEVLARKMPEFHHQIQRSYEPGCTLESTHFLIEADPYWKDHAPQLMKIAQLAEETRCESELVASLWRKPLFTSSTPRNLNAAMVPSRDLKSGKNALKPEFSGERIRLRIVSPKNSSFQTGSCHLAQTDDGVILTITAENFQELDRLGLRRSLRRETFYSTLRDGQEDRIFPQWLQNGLADVFAGQEAAPSRRTGNLIFCLSRVSSEPEDAHGQTAVSLVRYCLTSNDGKAFFPFWDQLAKMYSSGRESLRELGGNRLLSALEEKVRKNQMNSQEILRRFFNEIESDPRNESFVNWQNSLTSVSGGTPVRVFWFPEAQIVNGETQELPLPRLDLDESWKVVFLEMAQILKFTSLSPQGTSSVNQSHGVKIQEFGENRTQDYSPSDQESPEENSRTVTAEDLQKLESVFDWLIKNPQSALSLNADGSVFSEYFNPGQLNKLFHPQDRTYLLQEYDGNLVLSATFQDDYVLHVIMEKSPQASGVPEIRILGIEKPEKTGNQE